MKGYLIDEYILDFEELVRMAGYAIGSAKTMAMFLNRVDPGILCEVMKSLTPHDYHSLHQKVIDATKARQAVDNILKSQGLGQAAPRMPFKPQQPQQQQQQQGQNHPYQGNWHNNQFNSSNAPQRYNNMPVPMDIDQGRMNRGRGGSFRGQVASNKQGRNPQCTYLTCFNCGKAGTLHETAQTGSKLLTC